MKIIYKGTDIYPEISVNSLYHTMHCEKKSDEILLTLNDTDQLWNSWNPKKGDEIKVEDGAAKTGKMFVQAVEYGPSLITLTAYSMPQDIKDKRSKSWEKVRFKQLCDEIAQNHNLSTQYVGIHDKEYQYVSQNNQSDASFLYERCKIEGASYLIFDGKLVIYDEKTMEAKSPSETLTITPAYSYEYHDDGDDGFSACTVTNGKYTGTFKTSKGDQKKQMHKVVNYTFTSDEDAQKCAQNFLRNANKNMTTMIVWTEYMARTVAAGSVVEINTEGVKSWNGKAFCTDVRHDYVHNTSKLWLRKPLEGY